jgi:radical SAM superfamily enzyme YgiQ (UPF0313 family)
MNTYLLNPTLSGQPKYIREGRCMQKASSWATAWPPITLATLAALAKARGNVRLVDGNVEGLSLDALLADLEAFAPDLVVINSGFPSIDIDMAVAEAVKKRFPQVKTAAFGLYFTLLGKEAIDNYPCLDFAIAGEPEETFEELLAALSAGTGRYEDILGLAWRAGGQSHMNGPRPLIKDLDRLPFPDRSLLHNGRYRLPHNNKIYTLINTARGCPYQCIYCIVKPYYGDTVRRHSLDYIFREIAECIERHGIGEFLFWEEVFTLDRKLVLEFCRQIQERGLKFRWAATTRVTSVDAEVAAAMKQAGCYLLGLGVESASQAILDIARKQQTTDDVRRAVAACKAAGIRTMGHLIFGLPGETAESAEETIRFATRLGLDYMQCYCAVPYPRTQLWEIAGRNGWIRSAKWSQYDFGGESVMDTAGLKAEEISYFRRRAFRKFYLRPWYLAKTVVRTLSPAKLFRLSTFTDWMVLFRKERKT